MKIYIALIILLTSFQTYSQEIYYQFVSKDTPLNNIVENNFKKINKKFSFNYTNQKLIIKIIDYSNQKKNRVFDILSPGKIIQYNQNKQLVNNANKKSKYQYPIFQYQSKIEYYERIGKTRFDGLIKFINKDQISQYKERNISYTYIFIGFSLCLIIYHLIYFFLTKNKNYLYYTLFNLNYSIIILIFTFFFSYNFNLIGIENNLMFFTGINIYLYSLFSKKFLNFKRFLNEKILKYFKIIEYSVLTFSIAYLFVPPQLQPFFATMIDLTVLTLISLMFFYTLKIRKSNIIAKFYLSSWSLSMAGIFLLYIYEYTSWSIGGNEFFARYFILFGCIGEMLGNAFGLAYKMKVLEKEKIQAQVDARQKKKYQNSLRIVCHDLSNPLSSLQMALDMFKMDNGDDNKFIQMIDKSCIKISNLIEDVRNNEKNQTQTKYITSGESFKIIDQEFKLKLEEKSLKFNFSGDENVMIPIPANELINNILSNLMSNAIKFSYENKNIDFKIKETNNHVELVFQDEGMGMTQESINSIRNGDIVTSNGTNQEEGTGLGTQILINLIEDYDGELIINSKPNKGSSFKILIPKK